MNTPLLYHIVFNIPAGYRVTIPISSIKSTRRNLSNPRYPM
jgi:hypothetical protein